MATEALMRGNVASAHYSGKRLTASFYAFLPLVKKAGLCPPTPRVLLLFRYGDQR